MKSLSPLARFLGIVALSFALPVTATAAVRKEGSWPAAEKKVSLEFDGKPSEGLKSLASAAGWSLVVSKGIAMSEHDVHIDVEDQPADAVLDALFAESNVVARRSGTLLTITADAPTTPVPSASVAAPPPVAATSPAPPLPAARGEDKNVVGGSLTVLAGEIVHTVTVTGGSAKIAGTVTGDLVVMGGSAKIEGGGRVVGNAIVMGGSLKIASGARVDGDAAILGGSLKKEDGAVVGGKSVEGDKANVGISIEDGEVSTRVKEKHEREETGSPLARKASEFGHRLTAMSLLFVFGCVLLALANGRMERLRVEAAARPMRSFALGLVGALAFTIVATIVITILCITVVGIPLAILLVVTAIASVYGAIAAVLTTIGAALLQHKTSNPYVHLLVGCGVLLVVGALPWVGGLASFAMTMVAIGTLVSTRAAGFFEPKKRRAAGLT